MSLRTLMQAGPAKVNELFARLSETSDGAIKTREKLFEELKAELELHISLEEQHLFPVLRRNTETKALVADAIRDNRDLRTKLADLDTLPKNDAAFPEHLKDLQKAFRQHARDEKRELLPAVQRALSEEQVERVTEKIEAGVAEAEQARHEEAEARRAKVRQEREQAERESAVRAQAEAEREQQRAQDRRAEQETKAQRAAAEADEADPHAGGIADTSEHGDPAMRANVVQIAELAAAGIKRVAADATTRAMVPDLRAAVSLPGAAMHAAAEIQSEWIKYLRQTTLAGMKVSQAILCQAMEQQQLAIETVQRWTERNARMVQFGLDMTLAGLRPFASGSGIRSLGPRQTSPS